MTTQSVEPAKKRVKIKKKKQKQLSSKDHVNVTDGDGAQEKKKPKTSAPCRKRKLSSDTIVPDAEPKTNSKQKKLKAENVIDESESQAKKKKKKMKKKQSKPETVQEDKPETAAESHATKKEKEGVNICISDDELFLMKTFDEVLKYCKEQVKLGLISSAKSKNICKKWRRRETRRSDRADERNRAMPCFNCRQSGHMMSDCPVVTQSSHFATGVCFKCGSQEHSVHQCPSARSVKGYPFATCFICKAQGHLSKDCEQNEHGLYPDGGGCNLCGENSHLKANCPKLRGPSGSNDIAIEARCRVQKADTNNIDDEPIIIDRTPANIISKKTPKVVRF